VHPETTDQADTSSILALRDRVLTEHGKLDVLVNNAVLRPMNDWESEADKFAQSMAVNATGLFTITKAFGDHMAERGGGSIINIGSIQGMIGPDYTLYEGLGWGSPPDYFFHKGGMINFTRYVASRLGPRGVRCNTLSPGGFLNGQDTRFVERYCKRTLLGRMADDTDLKGAIVFLASDASAYVTGINLPVDAGYTAI
jgi:NAD(P)-dependent dehydrogenase (short-subunit alcohol dehydrogenase family)